MALLDRLASIQRSVAVAKAAVPGRAAHPDGASVIMYGIPIYGIYMSQSEL